MARIAQSLEAPTSTPRTIPLSRHQETPLRNTTMGQPSSENGKESRNGHLSLDVFSPLNQNGSFEFDRVLKTGTVQKRTKKTKGWKPVYLVLRPNLLSIYKNPQESRLRHQITLSELTAVAALKDKKQKRQHVFGLFTPSKNYHFEAESAASMREWVDLLRREARIDEDEADIYLASPSDHHESSFGGAGDHSKDTKHLRIENRRSYEGNRHSRLGSSSPEPSDPPISRQPTTRDGIRIPPVNIPKPRAASQIYDYSGNEMASFSDLSDSAPMGASFQESSFSLNQTDSEIADVSAGKTSSSLKDRPEAFRGTGRLSVSDVTGSKNGMTLAPEQPERVIWQGHLLLLRTRKGLRQWKRIWVVLRALQLAFYKNQDEYRALMIVPLSSLIDAVELDPLSKSKRFCMQVIGVEKSYRFCALSEEDLSKWLGAFKSVLAKRREQEKELDRELDKGKGKVS